MVVGLFGNESPDSNRFTLVTPKPENGVRLQATLQSEPHGLARGSSQFSRFYGGRLSVFRMMIISSSDYLTPAGRTTSVTRYPIRFVSEAKKLSKVIKAQQLK